MDYRSDGDNSLELILFTVALFIGGFTGDLALRRGLVIYRFGLLTAIQWYNEGKFISAVPVIRYGLILLFLVVLCTSVTYIVIIGYRDYTAPYAIGMVIMSYYGHSKSVRYKNNTEDFVKYNIEYIKE